MDPTLTPELSNREQKESDCLTELDYSFTSDTQETPEVKKNSFTNWFRNKKEENEGKGKELNREEKVQSLENENKSLTKQLEKIEKN